MKMKTAVYLKLTTMGADVLYTHIALMSYKKKCLRNSRASYLSMPAIFYRHHQNHMALLHHIAHREQNML